VNKKNAPKEKVKILIVEDSPTQAEQLKYLLEKHHYKVAVASNGVQALSLFEQHKPTLVISDIIMPEMDGYELCRQIKANGDAEDVPVILLTSLSESEEVLEGLRCGADIFITKPYNEDDLISNIQQILARKKRLKAERVPIDMEIMFAGKKRFVTGDQQQMFTLLISTYGAAVRKNADLNQAQDKLRYLNENLEDLVEKRTETLSLEIAEHQKAETRLQETLLGLRKALSEIIQVLAAVSEIRDPYTAGHQRRVANLAQAIAQELGLSPDRAEGIRVAGLIHDIGKMSIPAEILSKPGRLSEIEYKMIQSHAQIGHDILGDVIFAWPIAKIILQHHERMDGSGYPQQLKGDDIMLESRILAVSDVVEAMASHRPYRSALGIEAALKEIENNKGILYDPAVVSACLTLFREKRYALNE